MKPIELRMQQRLNTRLAELVELFLAESDPATWPGTETLSQRGDRYWFKRNAEATGRLAMRALALIVFDVGDKPLEGEERDVHEAAIEDEARRLSRDGVTLLRRWKERRNAR